jgi:hypothetical protein
MVTSQNVRRGMPEGGGADEGVTTGLIGESAFRARRRGRRF